MSDPFLQLLGICWRARALVAGEYPCLQALRAGRGALLILAADASANTAERLHATAKRRSVDCCVAYSKSALGHAVGQSQRAALLVLDKGFATRFQQLMEGQV
ncbi:MAG: L7Ae/L30e/S12e/Gadd45 family ribosomal protein [Bacillota bacterium]|jgi:ribosomal protein L7Ae-like RNA K-turn-binding protein